MINRNFFDHLLIQFDTWVRISGAINFQQKTRTEKVSNINLEFDWRECIFQVTAVSIIFSLSRLFRGTCCNAFPMYVEATKEKSVVAEK